MELVVSTAIVASLQKAWRVRNAYQHGSGVSDVDVLAALMRRRADRMALMPGHDWYYVCMSLHPILGLMLMLMPLLLPLLPLLPLLSGHDQQSPSLAAHHHLGVSSYPHGTHTPGVLLQLPLLLLLLLLLPLPLL